MEELIKSEGFWACVGALIGAISGIITTHITGKKTINLELRKISLSDLYIKRNKINEQIQNLVSIPENLVDEDSIEILRKIEKSLHLLMMYLNGNDVYISIINQILELNCYIEESKDNDLNNIYPYHDHSNDFIILPAEISSLCKAVRNLYKDELIKTNKEINKLKK